VKHDNVLVKPFYSHFISTGVQPYHYCWPHYTYFYELQHYGSKWSPSITFENRVCQIMSHLVMSISIMKCQTF